MAGGKNSARGTPQGEVVSPLLSLEWQKLRERNEALDCRVYARAAAWIAGRSVD